MMINVRMIKCLYGSTPCVSNLIGRTAYIWHHQHIRQALNQWKRDLWTEVTLQLIRVLYQQRYRQYDVELSVLKIRPESRGMIVGRRDDKHNTRHTLDKLDTPPAKDARSQAPFRIRGEPSLRIPWLPH